MNNVPAEWYQQGQWPLVGAIVVLLITNGVALLKIYLQVKNDFKLQLSIKQIELVSQQLAEFYNPLYSLILVNQSIFNAAGPATFPDDSIQRDAAGEVWSEIKEKLIIPNNKRIQEILRTKTHLLTTEDTLANYIVLQTHLAMYEVFQENPTEIYKDFQFPKNILGHVEAKREQIIDELNSLKQRRKQSEHK